MDTTMIDEHLENIDRRLTRIEQILPSLATKAEIATLATKAEIATLATKAEIATLATKAEIATLATKAEIATLATKAELAAAVAPLATKDNIGELRRYMDILNEDQRSNTRLLAEHLAVLASRLPDR
jgi:hypothetical protein